jgi:hypothetical protein
MAVGFIVVFSAIAKNLRRCPYLLPEKKIQFSYQFLVASRLNAAHCKDLEAVYMIPLTRDHSL